MQRHITGLATFAGHFEMRHAFARVPEVPNLELAQFLAAQRMEKQRRENGAVALAANAVVGWRIEQLARLMIAKSRCLAFAAFRLRPLDAFDWVMRDGVLLTEIFEQRGNRREPVPYSAAAEAAPHQVVAPGDDVRARDDPKFLRPCDAGEAHEILYRVLVDAARVRIAQIG